MLRIAALKKSLFLLIVSLTPALCFAEAEITHSFNAKVDARLVGSGSSYEYKEVGSQETSKGSSSSVDMLTKAIVGGVVKVKKNGWEAAAKVELDVNTDSDITAREKTIALKYGGYSLTYGTQYHWGVTVGNKYLTDEIGDIFWVGENLNERDDYLEIGFDFCEECRAKINLIIGENVREDDSLSSGNKYKETVLGAIVERRTDNFEIKASYIRVNTAVDSGLEDSASKESVVNGKAQTSVALGIGYQLTPNVSMSFNADFIRKKDGGEYSNDPDTNAERGNIVSDVINEQILVFILDVDLGCEEGLSLAYNSRSEKLGGAGDDPLIENRVVVGYRTQLANVNIHAQYYHSQQRDRDSDARETKEGLNQTDSKFGVGLGYKF